MEENIANEPAVLYGEKHYTYADYLDFTFDEMVEIIKGKIFKMSPAPSSNHQRLSRNLTTLIDIYLKNKKCEVFNAPFDVILPIKGKDFMQSDKVVHPDIVVICNPDLVKEQGCFGVPDWIIEILSPNTAKKDLQNKFDLYEEAGVKEYWIVDPKNNIVEVFVLGVDKYRRVKAYVQDDVIPCYTLNGFTVDLKEVFENDN
jgi:Uma2 family endonuclease